MHGGRERYKGKRNREKKYEVFPKEEHDHVQSTQYAHH